MKLGLTQIGGVLGGLLDTGSPGGGNGFLDSVKGPLLVVAIALALVLVIGFVILLTHRDGGKGGRSKGRGVRTLNTVKKKAPEEQGDRLKRRKRHKRRRREHRGRNPSLSETGGLPPMRDDEEKDVDEQSEDQ